MRTATNTINELHAKCDRLTTERDKLQTENTSQLKMGLWLRQMILCGVFYAPKEDIEEIRLSSGIHYSYEDTVYASDCYSSIEACKAAAIEQANRDNTNAAAEYVIALAAIGGDTT